MRFYTGLFILLLPVFLLGEAQANNRSAEPQNLELPNAVALDRSEHGRFRAADVSSLMSHAHRLESPTVNLVLDVDWVPEGYLTEEELVVQRQAVAQAQFEVLKLLPSHLTQDVRSDPSIPTIEIPADLTALLAVTELPVIRRMEVAGPVSPTLSTMISSTRSQAQTIHGRGSTGSGKYVVILDTGVTTAHAAMFGKVVNQACYSTHSGGYQSLCFGGGTSTTSSTAVGSGVDCYGTGITGCGHGTQMAAVAVANSSTIKGMAPDASVIAIQVFSHHLASNKALANRGDLASGLVRAYNLRGTYSIAAVNMSLGSGSYASTCDTVHSGVTSAAANLRSVGIIPVAASGNDGSKSGISFPACISSIVAVGATANGSDTIQGYSNSYTDLELLAPSQGAITPDASGSTSGTGGTSAASASVTGAIAALRTSYPGSVESMLASMKSAGVSLTDTNSIARPRISLDLALPPGSFTASTWYCFGQTTVSWSAVPTATSYTLQSAPFPYTAWTTRYSGSSTSPTVNIPQSSKFRVRACGSGRCGGYNENGPHAPYYTGCM